MFNVSGSEVFFLLIIGLVVLGPEKLPGVVRKVGQVYREIRNISDGFKQSVSEAVDEPLRELRNTTASVKDAISKIPLESTNTPSREVSEEEIETDNK